MHRNGAVAVITHLARMRDRCTAYRIVIGAERLEDAQAVLVEINTGAGGAEPIGPLVHAHLPAALRERAGCGQTREARADDLGSPLRHACGLGASCIPRDISFPGRLSMLRVTTSGEPQWPACAISPSASKTSRRPRNST